MNNTTVTKKTTVKRAWHLIDLKGQVLGRISVEIANLLMGKQKTYFTPALDCGDYIVAINAKDIKITGNKTNGKIYRHHTGYPGGFREFTLAQVQTKDTRRLILTSVKGMLPKNKLRDPRLKRLKVFVNDQHPYNHHFKGAYASSVKTP